MKMKLSLHGWVDEKVTEAAIAMARPHPDPLPQGEGERSLNRAGAWRSWRRISCVLSAVLMASALTAREPLPQTNPPPSIVTLTDFKLLGHFNSDRAVFTLTATANVEDARGGSLDLLSGAVALTEVGTHPKWELRAEQGRYVAVFAHSGKYPLQITFTAAVQHNGGWRAVDFRVAPSAVQPVTLAGLGADTQFEFAGAARPERKDNGFASFLPSDGTVKLSWKEARQGRGGQTILRRRNAVTNQRQSRVDAAGGPARFQSDAG